MFNNDYKSAVLKAVEICEAVADGNFEARIINITEKGDAGRLLHAINRLIDRSDAYVRETRASLEYVAANKYFRRISIRGMSGAFGEASQVVNNAMETMEQKVTDFSAVIGGFEGQMGEVVEAVASAATELQASAETLSASSTSASDQSNNVATAAEQASANVGSVAAATEELTNSVDEINQQVTQSTEATLSAVKDVEQTKKDISGLSDASEKIGQVVSLISDIAAQTNLLALNATIEAARAGEAGKGFAVVASEVKALADQTAKATEEIETQIGGIQAASNQAVGSIETIGGSIARINEIASAIAAAVEEQSAATREIARNIEQASVGTSEVSTNIQDISSSIGQSGEAAGQVLEAANELAQKGEEMRGGIADFIQEVRKVI
ncbi:MAG: methyl-accepting chemotaxis protein [Rhizobiales bacterium]|nr:methyl-accepting chemotaxis protein [Hyphomicrobiales bacterium]